MPWLSLPALARWLAWWRHPVRCHGEPQSCPECQRDGIDVFLRRDWFSEGRHGSTQQDGQWRAWWEATHTCPTCQRRVTVRVER